MSKKLRLGLVLQGGPSWVGGAEYSRNLIKALYRLPAAIQETFEIRILSNEKIDKGLYADMPARFWQELRQDLLGVREPVWMRIARRLAPTHLPNGPLLLRHAWRLGVGFLFPFNLPAVNYGRIASAAWFPDLQHRRMPECFTEEEWRLRDDCYALAAKNAPAVVLSSETGAREARAFWPAAANKAHVLRFHTVAEDAWFQQDASALAQKYDLPGRFFIVCNQFWKHKNHQTLFAAIGKLKQQGRAPFVVCTGKLEDYRNPEFAGEVVRMIDREGIGEHIRLLGLLPRSEQIQLMRRSLAVIQPSLFEGWSTVVEDCRALGKRMALSDLPVHREQNPPDAVFFPAHDAEQLAQVLAEWWRNLPAGPDDVKELASRAANQTDVANFGERFLRLAQSIVVPR